MDSFRSVGVKVPYSSDGPFWVLADGRKMLAPFGSLGSASNASFPKVQCFSFCVLVSWLLAYQAVNRSAPTPLPRRFASWEIRALQEQSFLWLSHF